MVMMMQMIQNADANVTILPQLWQMLPCTVKLLSETVTGFCLQGLQAMNIILWHAPFLLEAHKHDLWKPSIQKHLDLVLNWVGRAFPN